MRSTRLFTLLVAGVAGFAVQAQPQPAKRLNVLFIIADDLRTELGAYGSPLAKTPNIDALAKTGVRFDRAYTQFPLCNPSRVSMLTGRVPAATGVLGNRTDFRVAHPEWVTLPQLFKQNGYATLRTGKIFHGGIDDAVSWTEGGDPARPLTTQAPSAPRNPQNSDRWIVLDGDGENHADYRVADRAIESLRAHRHQSFFLAVGFGKPHSPPTAPKKFYGRRADTAAARQMVEGGVALRAGHADAVHRRCARPRRQRPQHGPGRPESRYLPHAGGARRAATCRKRRRAESGAASRQSGRPVGASGVQRVERRRPNVPWRCGED